MKVRFVDSRFTETKQYLVFELLNMRSDEKNAIKDKVYNLKLSGVKKARSTGDNSQNHHLNGHISQLSKFSGYTFDEMKLLVKDFAFKNLQGVGKRIYIKTEPYIVFPSESEVNVSECAKWIEACHYLAAEFNVILKE